ncbi:MAG: DUF1553 domain-containing protein [Planctomycetes bacterium]|nr:DUF1553 domain-containing protein [Planctomycetota bacterium]
MNSTAWIACIALVMLCGLPRTSAQAVRPFEQDDWPIPANIVVEQVLAGLREAGLAPARPCSDEVFIRRVFLDVIGAVPSAAEAVKFLEDKSPNKRAALIDSLLERSEFADYWAMKWCDLLRVKAEFPINLWPNAVQAYHRWIRDAVARNMPYDQFARELLTSSGSNFRVGPVNFYRAVQGRTPAAIAGGVALTFMGTRFENWPPEKRSAMEFFFSRVAFKSTAEWKEEIVHLDPNPVATCDAVFPDGSTVHVNPGDDPRRIFADWLIAADNPWFARAAVNRIWAWLLGRGIVHEPDDFRPDNPPSTERLLACLESELLKAKYDLRHVYRLILNSRTYQQSSIPVKANDKAEALFAHYLVRRLDPEVLIDAICTVLGSTERYTSVIPEPFTVIPEGERAVALADGSISSPFLDMFGRPARDTGLWSERNNQPTDAQRLYLLNSSHIQRKIESSRRVQEILASSGRDRRKVVRAVYLAILSRGPTDAEVTAASKYYDNKDLNGKAALDDLVWSLINTMEFTCRH